jgi:hypothetical protein
MKVFLKKKNVFRSNHLKTSFYTFAQIFSLKKRLRKLARFFSIHIVLFQNVAVNGSEVGLLNI